MTPGATSRASSPATPARLDWRLVAALLGAPVAWVLHLNGAYVLVALWCAEGWRGATLAVAALTVVCLALCVVSAILARRQWRRGQAALQADAEPGVPQSWDARMGERGARGSFLAVLALFMAALFALLVLLQAVPPFVVPHCKPGLGPT